MQELCDKGVVRKLQVGEPEPLFVSNIVLVRGAQSGQDYRACANLVEVNARTRPPAHPIPDCRQVIDATHRSTFFSPLDLKAGFHNIPIYQPHRTYAGIITQDGIYEWIRMPFGFLGAPAHFQAVLRQIFNVPEGPRQVEVYYDDIMPHGTTLGEVWADTVRTIACLAKWGFMINLAKSTFLVTEATLLGFDVRDGGC